MHSSHVGDSHRATVGDDDFYSFRGMACEGQPHTRQTDAQTVASSIAHSQNSADWSALPLPQPELTDTGESNALAVAALKIRDGIVFCFFWGVC